MERINKFKIQKVEMILYFFLLFFVFEGCSTNKSLNLEEIKEQCLVIAEKHFPRANLIIMGIEEDSCFLEIEGNSNLPQIPETSRLIGPRIARVDLQSQQLFMLPRR